MKKFLKWKIFPTETIYIYGTKIEAYTNKYTFVWKKSIEKYRARLDKKNFELISNFNDDFNLQYDNFLEIYSYLSKLNFQIFKGKGKRKSKE
ncbi:hypothetical protein [Fusobacterium ulcerans]|uniref:hypothetical protein n=1 Tax=Fusobacterium ulcerans TaxID=861 RepID=UPI0030CE50DF